MLKTAAAAPTTGTRGFISANGVVVRPPSRHKCVRWMRYPSITPSTKRIKIRVGLFAEMSSTLCTGTRHGHLRRHATTALPRASMTVFSARESSTRCTTRFLKWHPCDTRIRVSTLEPPSSATEHVKWFDKFSEFWLTAHSAEDLQRILSNETGKFIFVDFYAGHCGACRVRLCCGFSDL